MTRPTHKRRIGALLVAALAASVSAAFVPAAANAAADDIPSNAGTNVGVLHVSPTSGDWNTKLTRVWTDSAFDSSVTTSNHPYVWLMLQKGNPTGNLATLNSNAGYKGPLYGPYNFGSAAEATGGDIIGKDFDYALLDVFTVNKATVGQTFSVVLQAKASTSNPAASDPYFRADFEVTSTGWKLVGSETPKTDTTTTLATSDITGSSATVTATVAPSAATGTVQFAKDGTAVGSPVTVSGGVAQTTLTGLSAGTSYAITAAYSGDSTYNASTGSVSVKTTDPIATAPVTVGVTVPAATTAGPTGLKLTAPSSSITLNGSGTRTSGQVWTATGSLDTVTVNDDRQNASAGGWTLNGRISALTSGSNSIAASNVGWKPEKVDGSGTAGTEVTAGANGGLGADKPFATGNASADANVATKVKATVTLTTPAEAPSGDYTGTLTLTLI